MSYLKMKNSRPDPIFELVSNFEPKGDQPKAIENLVKNLRKNVRYQTLLGVTGSGKTYTMAKVIERVNRPILVISHNKTLAAQLYAEFKEFFPKNKVRYFVSYYDYYQPEAYIPQSDTYIEKDASINDDIDRLRLATTSTLLSRRDVIVVASVSCIYPSGDPQDHLSMLLHLSIGQKIGRKDILRRLIDGQYERNQFDLGRAKFRCRGDIIEIVPAYQEEGIRIEMSEGKVNKLTTFDPLTGKRIREEEEINIYPAKQFVMPGNKIKRAIKSIHNELKEKIAQLNRENKLLEVERLERRTLYDIEMLSELGYCHGVENYSRHFDGRLPGERTLCLIDYFPEDYLLFIDESHVTIPQLKGMFSGDHSRKEVLIEYGFRLPSALDNRPLKLSEFEKLIKNVIFVSATPGSLELNLSEAKDVLEKSPFVVEQIIRPTGLLDPAIILKPTKGQIDDIIGEIRERVERKERTLIITLSRHMAEELADYLKEFKIKVEYVHYEVDTFKRVELLRKLREAEFDVLVGINLLREGLDLPEVSLVVILDADKEGFLRSATSLLQITGRAARNLNGKVIMYADRISRAMQLAMDETERRRKIQEEYNVKYNITPRSIKKGIYKGIEEIISKEPRVRISEEIGEYKDRNLTSLVKRLEREMVNAAKELDFERAAKLRDKIKELKGEKEVERYWSKRPYPVRSKVSNGTYKVGTGQRYR